MHIPDQMTQLNDLFKKKENYKNKFKTKVCNEKKLQSHFDFYLQNKRACSLQNPAFKGSLRNILHILQKSHD